MEQVEKAAEVDSSILQESSRLGHESIANELERQRSLWWLSTLKETPNPGSYETRDFIEEMNKNPISRHYSFKTQGRKHSAYPHGRGEVLMPGLYDVPDSFKSLDLRPATYNFKAPARQPLVRETNAPPPNQYRVENLGSFDGSKSNAKLSSFKTEVKRFPVFKPREGPGPGYYEPQLLKQDLTISSSFTSREPRFKSSVSAVPGPGSYDRCCYDKSRAHLTKILNNMGRKNGLFFSYSPNI